MKTAGDILSSIFDERFVKKAQGYSKFFDSWIDITAKNGIASAADHSRIKELEKGIILIETDHPGWKQILQTKQTKILNDFRIRFPEMDISGISLILGKIQQVKEQSETKQNITEEEPIKSVIEDKSPEFPSKLPAEETLTGYDAIKDKDFRDKLIKLGKSIEESEKRINN